MLSPASGFTAMARHMVSYRYLELHGAQGTDTGGNSIGSSYELLPMVGFSMPQTCSLL